MPTQRQLFLHHLAQTSDIPLGLEIERAEGCMMWDKDGKKYLDLIAGISVSSLGHRHPAVLKAIAAQLDKYMHLMVYGEYIQSPQVEFATLLKAHLPATLNTVYFTNSGTEATEGAMKLAKRATGRSEFVSCKNAYHGSSQGSLSLAGNEWLKSSFRPLLPGITNIDFNKKEDFKHITRQTAAVFIEPVQAEAGALVPDEDYLKSLQAHCNTVGALLVFDEIQTGMGRTGTLWAMEVENALPDILLTGKALGGGMPLGAFVAGHDLMKLLSFNPVLGHITTFGGHPVSCAAGKAALEALITGNVINSVNAKEKLFRELLVSPRIKGLHGRGLLLAMELENFQEVQLLIAHCLKKGVVTDWFLFNDRCIRIAPPLIITESEIRFACEVIMEGVMNLN
ncbi:MAG: aspartate aminotransferase family protein [Bacteroidota bacterium]|nr:aspartate aminotransferase family protein [Bacteroidota bacterium]